MPRAPRTHLPNPTGKHDEPAKPDSTWERAIEQVKLDKQKNSGRRSVAEVYDAVLDVKAGVLDVKNDVITLKIHVNERNEAIEEHIEQLRTAIDGKLSNGELLTSLGFALMNHRWIRWTVGVLATAVLGRLAVQQWSGSLAHVAEFLRSHPFPF